MFIFDMLKYEHFILNKILLLRMIKQFQNILQTPTNRLLSPLTNLQTQILEILRKIFVKPSQIQQLTQLVTKYVQTDKAQIKSNNSLSITQPINPNYLPSNSKNTQISKMIQKVQNQQIIQRIPTDSITINLKLIESIVNMVDNNYICIEDYQSLQSQTQKAQATIRYHIKLENEMDTYITSLQKKLAYYEQSMKSVDVHKFRKQHEQIDQKMSELYKIEISKMHNENRQLKQQICCLSAELLKVCAVLKSQRDSELCRKLINPLHFRMQNIKQQQIQKFPENLQSIKSTKNSKNYQFYKEISGLMESEVRIECTTQTDQNSDVFYSYKNESSRLRQINKCFSNQSL